MSKGSARSVTRAAPFARRWTISRRVGAEIAAKARSRTGVIYSTYGLNIAPGPPASSDRGNLSPSGAVQTLAQVTADAPIAVDPAPLTARVSPGRKGRAGERFTH